MHSVWGQPQKAGSVSQHYGGCEGASMGLSTAPCTQVGSLLQCNPICIYSTWGGVPKSCP